LDLRELCGVADEPIPVIRYVRRKNHAPFGIARVAAPGRSLETLSEKQATLKRVSAAPAAQESASEVEALSMRISKTV
jgi:hypothetical protein